MSGRPGPEAELGGASTAPSGLMSSQGGISTGVTMSMESVSPARQ